MPRRARPSRLGSIACGFALLAATTGCSVADRFTGQQPEPPPDSATSW